MNLPKAYAFCLLASPLTVMDAAGNHVHISVSIPNGLRGAADQRSQQARQMKNGAAPGPACRVPRIAMAQLY
jgi:hypothetical protein